MRKTGTAAAEAFEPEAALEGDPVSEILVGHCHQAFMEQLLCPIPVYSQPNVILSNPVKCCPRGTDQDTNPESLGELPKD